MPAIDPLLWIGEGKWPLKRDRHDDMVMDSAINYYGEQDPTLRYSPGKLFLDNGAFSASMRGIKLNPDRVISLQEKLKPSLTIPLDYPFGRHTFSVPQMRKRWVRTRDNILYWQSSTN